MLDHILDEFEEQLTHIYKSKEIKYGTAAESPQVISSFNQNVLLIDH